MELHNREKLPHNFYLQDTIEVARQLLGCHLVYINERQQRLSGIITETEAYLGLEDPACHSFHGNVTERTKTFYLSGGHSYVYLIYGMYHCFNVVTGSESTPEAVLIRGLIPISGIEEMRRQRPKSRRDLDLTNGPGKLCQSFSIDKSHNAVALFESDQLFIESSELTSKKKTIHESTRIGIESYGDAAHWPLRYFISLAHEK